MSIKTGLEYIGYIDPWTDEERLSDEEIVRCRDCVSFNHRDELGTWCCLYGTGFYRSPRYEGDYCSRGKRRDA